jgi:two-component system, NtrC family, sensor kinase
MSPESQPDNTSLEKKIKKQLHLPLIISLICLLATLKIWDYYFNSPDPIDRNWFSVFILIVGSFISAAIGYVVWTLEAGKDYLEKEIQHRAQQMILKERETVAAEARALEARLKQKEMEEAYEKLKKANEQLVQSEKLASIGRVIAGLVHELKTPLLTVCGYSNMILKDFDPSHVKKQVNIIQRQAHRCLSMVEGLLTFSRHEKLRLESFDIKDLFTRTLEGLPLEFQLDGIEVEKNFPIEEVMLRADPDQLQELFSNLMINSWQALRETSIPKKRISIHVSIAGEVIQIFLTDNGPGIPKENLNQVFEPFFTTKPAGQGTGLGLSLCYGVVSMHGGKISVQSEKGKGTTFLIELPKNPLQVHRSDENKIKEKKKILVVDDEYAVVDFVKTILQSWNYEPIAVGSGTEALKYLKESKEPVDLVILDIHLPQINGYEVADQLRKDSRFADLPILFLTGHSDPADIRKCKEMEIDAYLSKPFDYQDLHKSITTTLLKHFDFSKKSAA